MRRVGRRAFERRDDHRLDARVVDATPSSRALLVFETLETNLASLPGVKSVALAAQTPPSYFSTASFLIEGREVAEEGALKNAFFTAVSPNYFATMGIRLVSGRGLSRDDARDALPAARTPDQGLIDDGSEWRRGP